uniref:NADH-ubiquinone oxidoreductase chain 2 n=1 Tax=Macrophthalmus abbreviatus TaxID=220121 RepID=A0A891GZP2_9EUCA|nr:NADH dehydrogenase subunit 2 [Macrophthalmus abbreviatus]QRK27332.1 NADH dehydrogenase subunit 2 [Macrophthalmus abbreviatus]
MMFPISYALFFFTLILGSLISISSSSWFGGWVGLELNMLSFIPLITLKMNSYFSEAALKYFLIQALGSALFIYASCVSISFYNLTHIFTLFALLLKLAAAPFHFWFPQVVEGLHWPQMFILSTIQKLAPMVLISYLTSFPILTKTITVSAVLSALVGAWSGLNLTLLRKILAFSSINHMSWMLIAISISDTLWFMYFMFYSLISLSVMMMFYKTQAFSLSQVTQSNQTSALYKITLSLSMLSLGGLPPLSGFIPKWMIAQIMMNMKMMIPLFFLLASALVTLYFYLRISIPLFIMYSPSSNFNMKHTIMTPTSTLFIIFTSFNLYGMLLPLYPLLI